MFKDIDSYITLPLQEPTCTSSLSMICAKKIKVDYSQCLSPCSGIVLTSFSKSTPMKNLEGLLSTEVIEYNQYMKWSPFPDFLKGELNTKYSL